MSEEPRFIQDKDKTIEVQNRTRADLQGTSHFSDEQQENITRSWFVLLDQKTGLSLTLRRQSPGGVHGRDVLEVYDPEGDKDFHTKVTDFMANLSAESKKDVYYRFERPVAYRADPNGQTDELIWDY